MVGGDYDEYLYGRPLDWSCITDVSPKLGPQYDKYGREIPELDLFHNSEFGSLTIYIDEEDDIDARLALLYRNLMIHSFKNLTLENLKDEDERMEGSELEYFTQYVCPSNKGRQALFRERIDSIVRLDGDTRVLMLKEERAH